MTTESMSKLAENDAHCYTLVALVQSTTMPDNKAIIIRMANFTKTRNDIECSTALKMP
jgi:hypothetical protein